MEKSLRNTILVATMLSVVPFMQGCTDEELATGAAVVAIGAGAAAIGAAAARRDHHDDHRDFGRHEPDRGGFRRHSVGDMTEPTNLDSPAGVSSADWAERFQLSQASAEMLTSSLDKSRQGDLSALQTVGLNRDDVVRLAQAQPLEQASIERMATALQQDPTATQQMVNDLMSAAQADVKDVQGHIWQECMASGQWKTPQNAYCTNKDWTGCSPASGASACIPAK